MIEPAAHPFAGAIAMVLGSWRAPRPVELRQLRATQGQQHARAVAARW